MNYRALAGRFAPRRALLVFVLIAMSGLACGLPGSARASSPPAVEGISASHVTQSDATLEAQINPQDLQRGAHYQFQVVTDSGDYLSEIVCPPQLPPGSDGCGGTQAASALPIGFVARGIGTSSVSLDLAGAGLTLQPGTTYHYRVLAARAAQTEDTTAWEAPTVYGPDQTFTTPADAPSIDSETVSHVTQSDATLEAQINPQDLQRGAHYQFQVVTDSGDYLSEIVCPPQLPPGSDGCGGTQAASALPIGFVARGIGTSSVSLDLAGAGLTLQPGTTYHYRVLAARAAQTEDTTAWEAPTVYGPDQTFTTPADAPSIDSAAASAPLVASGGGLLGSYPFSGPLVLNKKHIVIPTSAQKLAKALKVCNRKPKKQRANCKKLARERYGTSGKKTGKEISKGKK